MTLRNEIGAFSHLAIFQATDPPICTAGPSGPSGNPLPIAIIPANNFTIPTLNPMGTGLWRRKAMIWLTPAPFAAGEKF